MDILDRLHLSPLALSFRRSGPAAVLVLVALLSGAFGVAHAQDAGTSADDPDESPAAVERPTNQSGPVLVGRIDGEIDLVESAYLSRLLAEAETRSAAAVLLELNTFGGRVDAAVAMRDRLLDALEQELEAAR